MRPGLTFWGTTSQAVRDAGKARLSKIVHGNIDRLAAHFYDAFLADAEASAYLSHSVVHERLSHSLRSWLVQLVSADPHADMAAFDARQIKIGEVHARLKIPNHLVLEGATLLKTDIARELVRLRLDAQATAEAMMLLEEIVDYSMRLMSAAYFSDTSRRVQTDEAFRLFSLGQDINLERETQRAALMEWSQSILFNLFGDERNPVSLLSASPFGLWVRHRAAVLFQGSPQLSAIATLIDQIDIEALPALSGSNKEAIAQLQRRVDELKFLLNDLFQAAAGLENGRDPLTRTLNRRFLPSVLGRELSFAKSGGTALSLLMVDVDHFKAINDKHGHSVGDLALSHTAELLLNAIRASDFVFRYGGEEFLIVLVESDGAEAYEVAQRIVKVVAKDRITLPNTESLSMTVSIGVATYEGHPDYQYLIDAADKALYAAKALGRNRVEVSRPRL